MNSEKEPRKISKKDLANARKGERRAQERKKPDVWLASTDELLQHEDDLIVYQRELNLHRQLLSRSKIHQHIYRLHCQIGVSEAAVRKHFIAQCFPQSNIDPAEAQAELQAEINPNKHQQVHSVLTNLINSLTRSGTLRSEETELWQEMLKDSNLPLNQLYAETIRILDEKTALIALQVEWLTRQPEPVPALQPAVEADTETPPRSEETVPVEGGTETPFILQGWQLFWTDVDWSRLSQHLVLIDTGSRQTALRDISQVARGEVMIKPGSILRALEFHLQKDVIQKALATRNRYAPEDIREWIKLKRGRVRIHLLLPEEGRAIFFAANRDKAYRSLST